jgi:hypothetical protein
LSIYCEAGGLATNYYVNGGTNSSVGIKAGIDIIMGGVGFLGPIGFERQLALIGTKNINNLVRLAQRRFYLNPLFRQIIIQSVFRVIMLLPCPYLYIFLFMILTII